MSFKIENVYKLCEEINLKCLSTEYISIKSNLRFICNDCGEVFERSFDNLKTRKSNICNKCGKAKSNKDRVFSYDYVKDFIELNDCKLLSKEYVNIDSELNIKCNCGNEFSTTFYKFKERNKRQCNDCGNKIKAIKNSISESEIIDMLNIDGYVLLDKKLDGGDQRILIQCDKKHTPYWVNVSKYKSTGRRCPYCQNSKGEKAIEKFLISNNVSFKSQFSFDDLKGLGSGKLRFDFCILNNDKIDYLLEYDGEMHYLETGLGNDLTKQKIHDSLKDKYCSENKIKLIRIPYWDFDNIEEILNNV